MSTVCDDDTEDCIDAAIADGPAGDAADDCAKKYAECGGAESESNPDSFDDDYCTVMKGLDSELVSKLSKCFEKSCAQIEDCLGVTVEAFAPGRELD